MDKKSPISHTLLSTAFLIVCSAAGLYFVLLASPSAEVLSQLPATLSALTLFTFVALGGVSVLRVAIAFSRYAEKRVEQTHSIHSEHSAIRSADVVPRLDDPVVSLLVGDDELGEESNAANIGDNTFTHPRSDRDRASGRARGYRERLARRASIGSIER